MTTWASAVRGRGPRRMWRPAESRRETVERWPPNANKKSEEANFVTLGANAVENMNSKKCAPSMATQIQRYFTTDMTRCQCCVSTALENFSHPTPALRVTNQVCLRAENKFTSSDKWCSKGLLLDSGRKKLRK